MMSAQWNASHFHLIYYENNISNKKTIASHLHSLYWRQNLFNVNWDSLFFLTNDIELITNEITNAILSAAESSIPSKILTIRKGGLKWISCNILKMIRKKNRIHRKAKKQFRRGLRIIYEPYYRTMISYLVGECRSYSSVYQPINIICQYKIN
jgi:hypothetical protein